MKKDSIPIAELKKIIAEMKRGCNVSECKTCETLYDLEQKLKQKGYLK